MPGAWALGQHRDWWGRDADAKIRTCIYLNIYLISFVYHGSMWDLKAPMTLRELMLMANAYWTTGAEGARNLIFNIGRFSKVSEQLPNHWSFPCSCPLICSMSCKKKDNEWNDFTIVSHTTNIVVLPVTIQVYNTYSCISRDEILNTV